MRLHADPLLLLGYALGSCLSLVMLGSVSPDRFVQQAIILVVGLFIFLYLSRQEDSVYKSFAAFGYIGSIIALIVTIIFAASTRGTLSWLDIGGFRFQPSELTKPFLILAFAYILEHFPPKNILNILIIFFPFY